jgi:hypothetical protein
MTPESFPGSTLGRVLCAVVLLVLLIAAVWAVVQSLTNFRAIMV